jgi:ACS family hexuronate transporter-like MFS transporter
MGLTDAPRRLHSRNGRILRSSVNFRWVIVGLLAFAALLNYIDRQSLSLMASVVQHDLGIDDEGYALLVNAFLAAYMLGGILSAFLVDRMGARLTMMLFVVAWSAASGLAGLANALWQLAALRFALGVAEAGGWIASPKLVQEWFPKTEHAFAIGLYSSAAHFGAAISPLLVTSLLLAVGWRLTFGLTGLLGLVWFVTWTIVYPAHRLPVTAGVSSTEDRVEACHIPRTGWLKVLSTPGVWLIALCNSLTNPVWFFYLFWFPKYLTDERGLSIAEMGRVAWVVYASAGVGSLVGGALSGWAIKRGAAPPTARILVLALLAIIAPLGALNALAPPVVVSLALGSMVAFCHTAWVTNQSALLVDLYPGPQLAKAFATSGLLAGAVTIGSQYLIGQLVSSLTYRPMFLIIAVAYPFGLLAAWLATRAMRRRAWETRPDSHGGC